MLDEVIGNYKLLEKIEGGMGEVFKGIDLMLEREVAIKFLRPELARRPEIVERFRKGAMVLGRLNHPNIAILYSFVRHDDRFFMVMEFAHGQTLDRLIAEHRGGIPLEWALSLFCQALQAMEHAHRYGIIHRDIKPSNMMLDDKGVLKVLDFGIARVLGSARLTRTGLAVGTVKYMSPEQILGREIDARSDISSLGIVLYEMLSGRAPFGGLSEYELMRAQVEQPPPPLREVVPALPEPIEEAVMRALAKAPEERFQTVPEFLNTLGYSLPQTHSLERRVITTPSPPTLSTGERSAPPFNASPLPESDKKDRSEPLPSDDASRERGATHYELIDTLFQSPNARSPPLSEPRSTDSDASSSFEPATQLASVQPTEVAKAKQTPKRRVRFLGWPWRVRSLPPLRSTWKRHLRLVLFLILSGIALPLIGLFNETALFTPSPISEEEAWTQLLLERAREALAANKLTQPSGDNATEYKALGAGCSANSWQVKVGGIASQLQVFETERTLLQASQELLTNHQRILADTITLYKGLGGGWPAVTVEPKAKKTKMTKRAKAKKI